MTTATTRLTPFWQVIAAALCALVSVTAHAQQPKVTVEISPNPLTPNQVASLSITIDNGQPTGVPAPALPPPLGFASGVSTSQQMMFNNGVSSTSTTFTWGISCPQEGTFKLPPVEVSVGGQNIKTRELTIEVKAGAQPQQVDGKADGQDNGLGQFEPILQVIPPKTEFYQGEIVPIIATLYVPRTDKMNLRRIGLVEVEKNDLAIQRFPQQAEQSLETIGNMRYIAYTFRSTMSALKSGKMKVGPAKMDIMLEVVVSNGNRGFPFGFMQMEQRKATVKALEKTINVLPLPTDGKPRGFSGAVGDFTMSASSTVTEVTVGDPVTVDVQIEGSGNFDALEAPKLSDDKGWKTYPPKRYNVDNSDPNTADLLNRRLGFNHILVPEKVMNSVPPFEFSFFSPRTKQYTTLRSQPISLTIKPAPVVPGAVAAAGGDAVTPGLIKAEPPTQPPAADITDILMPIPPAPIWATSATPLFSDMRFVALNVLLLIGLGGWIAWTLWQRTLQTRASSPAYAQAKLLREIEAAGLSEAEFYRRAAHYVNTACAGRPPKETARIFTKYESLNFAGPTAGAQAVDAQERSEVLGILRTLKPSASATQPLPSTALTAVLLLALVGATSVQASPEQAYQDAAGALQKGDFKTAQTKAESIVKEGAIGSEVFTVLGHSAYKQGQPGLAAMWYQRAQLFPSSAPELRQNLRHIGEKIHFFTFQENEWIARFGLTFSRNTWALFTALGIWLAVGGAVLAWKTGKGLAIAAIPVGVVLGLLCFAGWHARPGYDDIESLSFVTNTNAQAHTAATQVSGTVIAVPQGSVVRKLDVRGNWTYVEIPQMADDDLRGWLPTNQLEPYWPYDPAKLP